MTAIEAQPTVYRKPGNAEPIGGNGWVSTESINARKCAKSSHLTCHYNQLAVPRDRCRTEKLGLSIK